MTTRRKFGMGIAAILAAQRAPAALVRSLVAARHIAATGTRLPYDAVEYLESYDGNQYIKTGVVGSELRTGGALACKFTFVSLYSFTPVMNIGQDHNLNFCGLNNSASAMYCRFNDYQIIFNADKFGLQSFVGETAKAEAKDGVFTIEMNNIVASKNYSFLCAENTAELFLFYKGFSWWKARFRVYSADVTNNNGIKIRDFQPVRFTNELGQSEGAMYDRVSGQLFRNQGTGAFVIGPVKARGASAQNGGGISG